MEDKSKKESADQWDSSGHENNKFISQHKRDSNPMIEDDIEIKFGDIVKHSTNKEEVNINMISRK